MSRRLIGGASPLAAFISVAFLLGAGSGAAAQSGGASGEIKGHPRAGVSGVTVSVADMMARQRTEDRRAAGQPQRLREAPEPGKRPLPAALTAQSVLPQLASQPANRVVGPKVPVTVGTSFLGIQISDTVGFIPPDSMGSVGPSQILVATNGRYKVFGKTGNPGGLSVTDDTFWNSVRNGTGVTDPEVEYDRLSGRWIVAAINVGSPTNRVMIAVSSSPTITNQSSFTFYFFDAFSGQFADYLQMGVDKNAVYIGVNNFNATETYTGSDGFVVRKSSILSGGPIVVTDFHNIATESSSGPFAPQGVQDTDPNVNEGYFIGVDSLSFSQLDIRRVTDPGGTPSLSGNLEVTVPSTYFPLNVPAQGTSTTLDALDDRLFSGMIQRGPDGTLSLWTAHNIRVNTSGVAEPAEPGQPTAGMRSAALTRPRA